MPDMADAASQAEETAERQKTAGAERVDEIAKAVYSAADEIGRQMPEAAELVHAAASKLEQGAEAVRERNLSDLMGTFNDMRAAIESKWPPQREAAISEL